MRCASAPNGWSARALIADCTIVRAGGATGNYTAF
jgi:hypothetical protein